MVDFQVFESLFIQVEISGLPLFWLTQKMLHWGHQHQNFGILIVPNES